jgi:hypothetical protein
VPQVNTYVTNVTINIKNIVGLVIIILLLTWFLVLESYYVLLRRILYTIRSSRFSYHYQLSYVMQ